MPFFGPRRLRASEKVVGEIRPATDSDLSVIQCTLLACAFEVGPVSDRAIERAIRLRRLLIHERTGSICRYYEAAGVTHISELCVLDSYRGLGIGRALLACLDLPIELTCRIENPSNAFYEHIGFTLVDVKVYKKWTVNVWRLS